MSQHSFMDLLTAAGWSRCAGPEVIRTVSAMVGSGTYRKGPTRVELSGDLMHEHDGAVHFSVRFDRGIALCALVVDKAEQGKGHGRAALVELCDLIERAGLAYVHLEAGPMARRYGGKMKRPALLEWYGRHGFAVEKGATRVMRKTFNVETV